MADQAQRRWYNDRELFLHGLARSNYVTAITDWFMGFAGKWAELVLYATVLYSCAELYPGVHLPDGLSLAVFLVQLGALDIGGLSLAKLAKQAREDGNAAGAKNAELLSKWLISIMIVGVVVVGLERALPVPLPSWVIITIDVLLVVARSICSVLYGKVVHDLKHEMVRMIPVIEVQANISELSTALERTLAARIAETEQRIMSTVQSQPAQPDMSLVLAQVVEQLDTRYSQHMETMIERTVEQVRVSIVQQSEQQQYNGRARLSIVNGHSMEVDTPGEIQVLPVNTTLDTSDSDIGLQIRTLLQEDSTLSGRALAGRVGCSPTTANKWKSRIEAELQAQ